MLKRIPKYLLFFLIIYLFKINASAQAVSDSANFKQASVYANVESDFYKKIGAQSRLYCGKQYDLYDPAIKGNPYFEDLNTWHKGSIYYDGYLYTNVSIMYDIYKDDVVILIYNNFMMLSLIKERVEYFNLVNHHFIRIKNDPANGNSLKTGFYDELYSGKIQVLSKKTKSLHTSTDLSAAITSYFSPTKDYYLFKNGKYYTVNSESAFLNELSDHKKEIKQYIKSNNIEFKLSPEQAMAAIAAYYDHLND